MVAGSRIDGGTQILSARVRKTIQSIKEIVGNHSDAEIYVALKETNMDPNETAQKLLNQDPFHEVRRKRDKKKEYTGYKGLTESRKSSERAGQGIKSNPPDRGVPRGGYSRNGVAGGSREFRVVRDNRINQNVNREVKPPFPQCSTSTSELGSLQVSENGSTGVNQKSSGANYSPRQASAVQTVSHTVVTQVQVSKPNDSKLLSSMLVSNHSVVGVYSSSSDPVHVPSPVSKSAANVGTIKREFGAVGVRRQPLEKSPPPSSVQSNSISSSHLGKDGIPSKEGLRRQLLEKSPLPSSAQSNSLSSSHLGKDGIPSKESFRSFTVTSTSDQPCQATGSESVLPSVSAGRSFSSNQYNSRSHQQVVGHQRASPPVREWKPKPSLKSSINGLGVIGSPVKPVSHPADSPQDLEIDATHVRDKLSRLNIYENENVFIAEHIRVSESDRCRLTFGSFGTEFDSSRLTESESRAVGGGEHSHTGLSTSLSASTPDSPTDGTSDSKHVDLFDDVRNSGSNTPASGALSEQQLSDRKDNSSPQNLDNYADIGLVHDNSPSFTHTESQQQQQDPPELASFSVYDPQTGYDIPYFRPTMDETVSGQGLPSPQEALGSHMSNNVPMSTISMVQQQQQQPPMPQMYQQLHVSPFANLMPYRQFLSPVYVPPLPMPGYSGNPTYPHPSNGNSFLLMPGGSSHLSANNLKYGIQQFKHVPTGSPTGFGNFASPTGYAVNPPGVVGGAAGLEESSRLKYKDGNLYVPNPQAETSEMWIQNPRDLPGLQSASYYNMAGQTPHGAYLPPHSGHTSFNAGVAQSSHMQFPGLYHPPPQPAAMANPHHLGPAMGSGSVGVGMAAAAASGAQVGAYQQQAQMGHLNWTTNF